MIYIYALKCPIENIVRYVGKSSDPRKRLLGHIGSALCGQYSHHTARWIRKLASLSLKPELVILHTVADDERWQEVERSFIASAASRGWRLTNSTAGGEGLDYLDPADDVLRRKKLSDAHKKIWRTPENRNLARQRSLAAWANPEITQRRIQSCKLAHSRPDVKARNLAVLDAIRSNPAYRKKKSETVKASWADPDTSAKRRAALSSDKTRTKMSASAKARWKDSQKSAKTLASFASPESRAKRAESAKRRSTPEYRAMMAAKTKANWASGSRKKHKRRSDATGESPCL